MVDLEEGFRTPSNVVQTWKTVRFEKPYPCLHGQLICSDAAVPNTLLPI
jgi:hypothetical protein